MLDSFSSDNVSFSPISHPSHLPNFLYVVGSNPRIQAAETKSRNTERQNTIPTDSLMPLSCPAQYLLVCFAVERELTRSGVVVPVIVGQGAFRSEHRLDRRRVGLSTRIEGTLALVGVPQGDELAAAGPSMRR